MKNRGKVFVQVKSKKTGRWSNYLAANTYDGAVEVMKKLQATFPDATLRVLDNNLTTHTK